MTSITWQKAELRDIIMARTERYLIACPELAITVALEAVRVMASKMTLKELRAWNMVQDTEVGEL